MSPELTSADTKAANAIAAHRPGSPAPAPSQGDLVIVRGTCSAFFAYDLGFSIDLNKAQRLLGDDPGGSQRRS